jgi:hypothetical protein
VAASAAAPMERHVPLKRTTVVATALCFALGALGASAQDKMGKMDKMEKPGAMK